MLRHAARCFFVQLYKGGYDLTRFVLFLFFYGICVMSISNIIMYLNYRTLGYAWRAVILYILNSVEIYLLCGALCGMFIVVYALSPSRSPFS